MYRFLFKKKKIIYLFKLLVTNFETDVLLLSNYACKLLRKNGISESYSIILCIKNFHKGLKI